LAPSAFFLHRTLFKNRRVTLLSVMNIDAEAPVSPPQSPDSSGGTPLLGYATGFHPAADPAATPIAFRQGVQLIAFNGTTLPSCCVLCGEPGIGPPIRLKLTWDESFKVTGISTLKLRQQALVFAFLCSLHRARWSNGIRRGGWGIGLSLLLMGIGGALAVFSENSDLPAYTEHGILLMIAGFAGVIVSLFYFTLLTRTLACSRIQEGYLYLEGAAEKFLATLPDLAHPSKGKEVVSPAHAARKS
jgi:hypothetical protein